MEGVQPIRPFLRWAGSKRQILPALAEYWPARSCRYLEPFAGSAALFFHLRPQAAILGDINAELIDTYEQVRDNLEDVEDELARLTNNKDEYYRIRAMSVDALPPASRAARFIYLNRFAFNGLYRTNQKGKFNVPYGGGRSGQLPDHMWLLQCSKALKSVVLISGTYSRVLELANRGDFVYLDPPYSVKARRVFREYDPSGFGAEELHSLRRWLHRMTSGGIEFLLSYAQCDEAERLMEGYSAREISVRRNIAGFTGNRRRAGEWLISNREALSRQEVPC